MTLIAAFASPSFAVVVADRRRTQLSTGVCVDDVRKVHQINKNVLVGFAGIFHSIGNGRFIGMAERVINDCFFRVTDDTKVDTVAEIYSDHILTRIKQGDPKELYEISYHLTGLNKEGKFTVARVSQFEDFCPVMYEPNENDVVWSISIPEYSPSEWINNKLTSMIDKNLDNIEGLARDLIIHTAEKDKYVSPEYDLLTLGALK